MIQEKYNKRIYDEAAEETLQNYSHLRCNVLSVVDIDHTDRVLLMGANSVAIEEWIGEHTGSLTVVNEQIKVASETLYTKIICMGTFASTPREMKNLLADGGDLILAISKDNGLGIVAPSLLKEAGFSAVLTYRVCPDYKFTTEIFAEDYQGGEAGDYLFIAR